MADRVKNQNKIYFHRAGRLSRNLHKKSFCGLWILQKKDYFSYIFMKKIIFNVNSSIFIEMK